MPVPIIPIIQKLVLTDPPVDSPKNYLEWINTDDKVYLEEIRKSVVKGVPFGRSDWVSSMVDKYNLKSTQRRVGRPNK